jgi:hypothetical protein
MNTEQTVLDAFKRGKAFGFAEGMKSMRLKELTDGEITEALEICDLEAECFVDGKLETKIRNFARAILRKAQEK